jgi:hypothetical protein
MQRTVVLTRGTAHFELRPTDNLGTNGGILKTDTPRQAAGCRFCPLNTAVELARVLIGGHA